DAGAGRIDVEIGGGGLNLIRVVDDGAGVAADELALAFQRHATSKLPAGADLGAVVTLGFRGEALPSIAAVADVEAASRDRASPFATYLRLRDGEVVEHDARGLPPGTSIAVHGLFRRQPARLKFLRAPAAEAAQVAIVVTHYALAYPEVRFSLTVDGRETFATAGTGDRRAAAAGVYGPAVPAGLAPGAGFGPSAWSAPRAAVDSAPYNAIARAPEETSFEAEDVFSLRASVSQAGLPRPAPAAPPGHQPSLPVRLPLMRPLG